MTETSEKLYDIIDRIIQVPDFERLLKISTFALARARQQGDQLTEVTALIGLAQAHIYRGQFADARILINGAIRLADEYDARMLKALALMSSADLHRLGTHQYNGAQRDSREALQIATQYEHPYLIARALLTLSQVYAAQSHAKKTTDYAREAFHIARELDDEQLQSIALALIAKGSLDTHLDRAIQAHDDANDLTKTNGFHLVELDLMLVMGELLCTHPRHVADGRDLLDYARQTAQDYESIPHQFLAWQQLGRSWVRHEQYETAQSHYADMLQQTQMWQIPAYEGDVFSAMAQLAFQQEDYTQSIHHYEQALHIAQETNNPFEEARLSHQLAQNYLALQQYERALDYYMAARSVYDALDDNAMATTMLSGIIHVYLRRLIDQVLSWLGLGKTQE